MSEPLIDPETLREHYSRFLNQERILLTGHSHQAWPNVAIEGLIDAFDDAAARVDEKWEVATKVAEGLRHTIGAKIGAASNEIALGQNCHELVTRFLSALNFRERPRLVTTTGEFHSMRRQLARLEEEGVEVVWVDANPVSTLWSRLASQLDQRTAAMLCSTVLFQTSECVPKLHLTAAMAASKGVEVLLDAYHGFGVTPVNCAEYGANVFLTAGGYKYAQWGEGNCFMRVPSASTLRPVYTGWFSDFENLDKPTSSRVTYGRTPADRFAGSTYDPMSHYRARAVYRFFERMRMTPPALTALYQQQTARIIDRLDGFEVLTPRDPDARGGFVAVRLEGADIVVRSMRSKGVWVDSRADVLRIGPAPYITDKEIDRAIAILKRITGG